MYDLLNWDAIREMSTFWWEKGWGSFSLKGFDRSIISFSSTFQFFFQVSHVQSWHFHTLPQLYNPCNNNKIHPPEVNSKYWLPSQYSSRGSCQGIKKAYKKVWATVQVVLLSAEQGRVTKLSAWLARTSLQPCMYRCESISCDSRAGTVTGELTWTPGSCLF